MNITEIAARIIKMVSADIAAGHIPADVKDFAELHDHVDANEYLMPFMEYLGGHDEDHTDYETVMNLVTEWLQDASRMIKEPQQYEGGKVAIRDIARKLSLVTDLPIDHCGEVAKQVAIEWQLLLPADKAKKPQVPAGTAQAILDQAQFYLTRFGVK